MAIPSTRPILMPTGSRTGGYEPIPGAYELKGVLIGSVGCSRKARRQFITFFFFVWGASNEGLTTVWAWPCSYLVVWAWTCSANMLLLMFLLFFIIFFLFGAW
jgi:hypothetical protein